MCIRTSTTLIEGLIQVKDKLAYTQSRSLVKNYKYWVLI